VGLADPVFLEGEVPVVIEHPGFGSGDVGGEPLAVVPGTATSGCLWWYLAAHGSPQPLASGQVSGRMAR